MGTGYLIDTNSAIDYLENKLPDKASIFIDNLSIQISVITRIELLAWPKITKNQTTVLSDFISVSNVLLLSEAIVLKTIEIRKNYKIKLPDAIIAATAIVGDLNLITRNISDFEKIIELNSINPYNLK